MAEKSGFIYFITNDNHSVVKVGFATDVDRRLYDLQVASFLELFVFDAFPGTTRDEAILKKRFRPHRIRGEWFRFHDDIFDFIEEAEDYRRAVFTEIFDPREHTSEQVISDALDRVAITCLLQGVTHRV
jgi:Meiotically up-regulated gene 113